MTKKKKYIRPETETVSLGSTTLLAGSTNDKPYGDAKQNTEMEWGDPWQDSEWQPVEDAYGLPKAKSLWDD